MAAAAPLYVALRIFPANAATLYPVDQRGEADARIDGTDGDPLSAHCSGDTRSRVKRQIGELQPSELVVTILILNIATLPIQDVNVPLSGGIVPILTIVCFEVFLSGVTMRSRGARRVFCGSPKVVIRDGVIQQKELRGLRFSADDLLEQLRTAGYFDPSQVLLAIVETTGSLSVYPKSKPARQPMATWALAGIRPLTHHRRYIIESGHILRRGMDQCGATMAWLGETLASEGVQPEEIWLMTCDRQLNYYLVRKERL